MWTRLIINFLSNGEDDTFLKKQREYIEYVHKQKSEIEAMRTGLGQTEQDFNAEILKVSVEQANESTRCAVETGQSNKNVVDLAQIKDVALEVEKLHLRFLAYPKLPDNPSLEDINLTMEEREKHHSNLSRVVAEVVASYQSMIRAIAVEAEKRREMADKIRSQQVTLGL